MSNVQELQIHPFKIFLYFSKVFFSFAIDFSKWKWIRVGLYRIHQKCIKNWCFVLQVALVSKSADSSSTKCTNSEKVGNADVMKQSPHLDPNNSRLRSARNLSWVEKSWSCLLTTYFWSFYSSKLGESPVVQNLLKLFVQKVKMEEHWISLKACPSTCSMTQRKYF